MRVLLLPGLDGTGKLFESYLELLPDSFSTRVCSLPPEGDQTASSIAASILARGLIDDTVFIIAESFSGPIAYELIQACGDRVKGLVLISSFLTVPRPILRMVPGSLLTMFPWHFVPAWALRYFCLGVHASDELIRKVQKVIQSVPTSTIANRVKALSGLKIPETKVYIPCLYLQAQRDRLVPEWHVKQLQNVCEDLTLKVIDGPHFLLQANPEACNEAIMNFIDSLEETGS